MTLLLGPPSSGKTTLLKALSGKLDKNLRVQYFSLSPLVYTLCRADFTFDTYNYSLTSFSMIRYLGKSPIAGTNFSNLFLRGHALT